MIMTGNQRGGARQMAQHLLNGHKNEHVSVHEVSGFVSSDVHGALNEIYAISKGTRCTQFMYSISLSPPPDKYVPIQTFEDTLGRIEKKLKLGGQPRVVVFHEKEGRRHAHCVWSRIDGEKMNAINISHPKLRLKTLAREIYLEQGWELPKGFVDRSQKNPLNFTRVEWEQAQRIGQDPRTIKTALQESWALSDNRQAFESALQDKGYFLARGDKRGYVCVDLYGEVYSLSRKVGCKKAELEQRLGKTENLRSVERTKETISSRLTKQFTTYHDDLLTQQAQEFKRIDSQKNRMTTEHRAKRERQQTEHEQRRKAENLKRSARLRKGFKGIWDRLTGTYQRTRKKNESEAYKNALRDLREKEVLIEAQLEKRQELQTRVQQLLQQHANQRATLVKGMNKHYKNIERQAEIGKMHKQLQQARKHEVGDDPEIEPDF